MSDSGAAAAAPAPATTTPAASKPAAEQTTTEKVVETVKRYIPGLAKQPDAASAPVKPAAKRSRSTKSKKAVVAGADDPALATATLAEAPEKSELPESLTVPSSNRPAPLSVNGGDQGAAAGLTDEELAALQHKRFSPVLSVQKKIRANNKKLQRVAAYEAETGQLNADQKKVVASKPALEAVQRELNELVKAFETEEADDEKRVAKKQQYQEKQTQLRINQALSNSKVSSQNDLTLLLQFLHLYSLFNPTHSHSNQVPPPVVSNATNEQTAAVHTLFNNLANGPLFGASADGSSDAVSQIKSLQDGSDKTIIEGVSFADVKQMIFDLTAPPAEVGHEIPEEEAHSNGLSLNGHDSSSLQMPSVTDQPPLAGASAASAPALNFMQASELQEGETAGFENDAPEHQRALESVSASATPGFGSGTPVVEQPEPTLQESAPAAGWNADSTQLTADALPSSGAAAWDDVNATEPVQNWADEVDEHPSNPFTATAEVPSELEGQNKDAIDAVPVGGEAPGVAAAAGAGTDGRGRGRGRGGRGRGEGRGRGRGGFRGEGGNWRNQETNGGAPASAVQQALSAAGDGFTDVHRRGNRGGAGGESRGGFRGGRGRGDGSRGDFRGGRGRGEGRGRGGPRSGPNTPTTQGAPAAAPSVGA